MGLRLRERRRAIFILIAICLPLIILTCQSVRASPDAGPDIEVPGGRKISDQGGMDVSAQQSSNAPPEGSVHIDETLSLAGMASGAGLAAARRMMMQRQQDEEEKRKKGPMGLGSSAQGRSSTKGAGSSATGFVWGRPFAQVEPPKAMPTSFSAQPIDKGASDDEAFPWHEVPGAFASTFASMPSGIWEGLKEDYGAWRAYFKDPTSVAPSNIAPYLTQFGYDEMGCRFKDINPEAGAAVMAAVDFFGLGKIPFTGNLPRGLILESLKHGGGLEGLQEGFRYTSVGQVCTLASMALDPSLDEHLRAQCSGQLMAQGSLIAFSMLGSKLIPKVKSGLAEALDDVKTGTKEAGQNLAYINTEEFIWRQAMYEAIQDSNLGAIAQMADDLGELESYYKNDGMSLILKGTTWKATEGHNIRVDLPANLIEATIAEEGPMQVELTNLKTGKTYSFYKAFHKVERPDIEIPSEIMQNFQAGQDVIVKIRTLPIWEFINSIEGDESWMVKFNKDGIPIADLGGKEVSIRSLDYDYRKIGKMGGMAYVEFQVEDVPYDARRFRIYDNGFSKPRLAIETGGTFRPINNIEYDPRVNYLVIGYNHSVDRNYETMLFFEESPGEIDFGNGRVPESMRIRVKSGNKHVKGDVGEEIAAKIVEEKFEATVFGKRKFTGPDREILIDGDPGILEAKLATSKQGLKRGLVEAVGDVYGRFEQSDEYKKGIAFSTYIDEETGHFEYIYKVVTRGTQHKALDQLPLTTYWTSKVREPGVNAGNQNQPMAQTFAGFSANQIMVSDVQYGYQQMVGTKQNRQQQQWIKTIGDITNAQSTSSNSSAANKQDTTGVGSNQYNIIHSQSKDQQRRLPNQPSEAPAQREQQVKKSDDGSRGTSKSKSNSPTNSQYKDREWTSSSSQSAELLAKHGGQEQGSRTKDDSAKAQSTSSNMSTTKTQDTGVGSKQWSLTHSQSKGQQQRSGQFSEAPTQKEQKTNKSDNGSKVDSGGKNKSPTNSQEQVKTNDKSKTSGNESKGKDPDSRNCASSARKGPRPI